MSTINSDKTRPKKSEVYKRAAELLTTGETKCISFRSSIFMAFRSFKAENDYYYGENDYYGEYDYYYEDFTEDEKVIALLFLAAMYDSMGE